MRRRQGSATGITFGVHQESLDEPAARAARGGPRRAGGWLVLAALLPAWVPAVRAEAEAIPTEPARWIAPDAALYLELPRPEVLIDRLTEPRIQDYFRVLPAYRKFLEGPTFSQIRAVAGLVAGR